MRASLVTAEGLLQALTRPRALRMLQVAGRKLLAGDSSQEEPSYADLFLQSYRGCEWSPMFLLTVSHSHAHCQRVKPFRF